MAKTLVKNKLGSKTKSFYLPADDVEAQAFCDNMLEGEYAGYASAGVVGTDTGAVAYNEVTLTVKDSAGVKAYLNMAVKSNLSEDEIYTALAGITVNGVLADEMYIRMKSVSA